MIKMKSRREMRFTRAAPDLRGFIQISSGLRKPPRICIKLFSRNRMECGLVVFATIANSGGRKREAHEQVRGQRFCCHSEQEPRHLADAEIDCRKTYPRQRLNVQPGDSAKGRADTFLRVRRGALLELRWPVRP